MPEKKTKQLIAILNRIMEAELAGVVRYTHYSLMVYGYQRIPIVSWLKGNASESLDHAYRAGDLVTLQSADVLVVNGARCIARAGSSATGI